VTARVRHRADPAAPVARALGHTRTAATAWVLVVCCLTVWSLAPVAIGWRPVLVLTGSMRPTIKPGDVVLVDTGNHHPTVGQIALLKDPDVASGRVTHRVVALRGDGSFVTQGDANAHVDARPARESDVLGVARMVVPGAGRPAMLAHRPGPLDLGWSALTLVALLVLALVRKR
jgi:signal peptidase I